MRSSSIRFTGMASGMDTDSIIRDMLRPQQHKIDSQKKAQALVKLKQDAWKDMNKKLFDFHTKFTEKLYRGSIFENSNTTSSNPDAMSITNGEGVPQGTHKFEISQLAESASVVGKVDNPKTFDVGTGGNITIKVKGGKVPKGEKSVTVEVKPGDTLSTIVNNMNTELEGTGFTARYDEANGSFFVSSTETGWKESIEFNDDSGGELLKKMGLDAGKEIRGKVAKYNYNGTEFTSATNNIEVNGIKATLKAPGTGPITISSQLDTDGIYDFVKEFVTEYNNLIDEINLKIGTKPGKDITPLTAEEREGMSESEIKLWEEKLNSSLFYRDEQLTDFIDSSRRILSQAFGGKSLSSIGIVTGSWEEKGKLHIEGDEDAGLLYANKPNKLKEAIEEDPQAVTDFLKTVGKALYEDHNKKLTASNDLKSAMNFYNDKVIDKKVQTFDKEISTLEDRMYRMEKMYVARFAAMEKMLSSLNSQSSWLSQQFGG